MSRKRRHSLGAEANSVPSDGQPIVKFGVLADVQDNKVAWYDPAKMRYYRESLKQVRKAFDHWVSEERPPSFTLQLGDLIDGLNRQAPNRMVALHEALEQFNPQIPTFHVIGNHELYNFGRAELVSLLGENLKLADHPHHDKRHLYYSFRPQPGIKVIAIDCFEISTMGYDKEDAIYKEAASILTRYHGHSDTLRWDQDGILEGLDRRFQEQNGGISEKQMEFLDKELSDSDANLEKVFIFGHCDLLPESCDPTCLVWNYDQVLACFHRHPSVVAYLSGHAHNAGHGTDDHGIHYIVFHGIIETSPESEAFATLSLFKDRLVVDGMGSEPSLTLPLVDRYLKFEKKAKGLDVDVSDGKKDAVTPVVEVSV